MSLSPSLSTNVSIAYPASGTVVGVEREPDGSSGVWTVRVQLPQNGSTHTITLLVDGLSLREPELLVWVK